MLPSGSPGEREESHARDDHVDRQHNGEHDQGEYRTAEQEDEAGYGGEHTESETPAPPLRRILDPPRHDRLDNPADEE